MVDPLSKPNPMIDGISDERSLAQRQGDALVEAAHQVLGFGELPDCGGERWAIRLDPDGYPVFTPPAIIDPGRTPRPSRLRC